MTDIIPCNDDLLYERAGTAYCDLWDETGLPPKLVQVAERLAERHPDEYADVAWSLEKLKTSTFDMILAERRKAHLMYTLAPKLLAAEMGARLGSKAFGILQERLDNDPDSVSPTVLNQIMKTGFELAGKVDRDVAEVTGTGNPTINVNFKELLISLGDEAPQVMAEIARRQQIGDGS